MKTAFDPRHQLRRVVVQELFADLFTKQASLNKVTQDVLAKKSELDHKIEKAAPSWPVDKLNKIDLAVLRLAIYELETKAAPPKVVIDEAVELAKEFGAESSPSFVNGVLGTIYEIKDDQQTT